ncbi:hypothetical protein CHS0354_017943 [Potamilus streckersoni]|uniref:Uncharacterized protein n=1 Tax=Potamilus streckersoni TaxID=2493646 RepID=A0AAE0VKZ3_9BIVA|nr:hypothetical protein CHS0354_017943 [Potamilus streckersoni]
MVRFMVSTTNRQLYYTDTANQRHMRHFTVPVETGLAKKMNTNEEFSELVKEADSFIDHKYETVIDERELKRRVHLP